jgi:hypothetical protein
MFKITVAKVSESGEVRTVWLGAVPEENQPLGIAGFEGKIVLKVTHIERDHYHVVVKA